MLTIENIKELAREHHLGLSIRWPQATTGIDEAPPKPRALTVYFNDDKPQAWKALMSQLTEVDVSIYGTRQVTGSGATDGRLKPAYAALLPEVNEQRALVGLARVYG